MSSRVLPDTDTDRMPATAEQPPTSVNGSPSPEFPPDETALVDKTPDWFRSSPGSSVFVLGLGVILVLFFGSAPLWHADLWDHINYGQRMIETRSIPSTEPLLPLAKGMPMVHTAWGAQVGMAAIYTNKWLGLPGLQFVNGLLVVIALAAVGWAIRRLSGSVSFAMIGYVVFLLLNWQQFLVFRPQLVGVTFFAILLAVLSTNQTRRTASWFVLPAMFAVWANFHGSFAIGLTLLGLFAIGRFVDTAFRTRSPRLTTRCRSAWRVIFLMQLCSAATLLNPNGLAVFGEVLRVGSHPNIASMYEWDPLTLRMKQGQAAAVVAVLLFFVLRLSPRRLRSDQVLALIAMGGMALWSSRMINWFAPVAALVLSVHGAAVWRMWRKQSRSTVPVTRRGIWTIATLGLCWICFGFTSLGVQTIHGKSPEPRRSLSRATPVDLGQYLATNATIPDGLVFAPAEWVGYLTNVRGGNFTPMVNLHVHVIPEEVWSAYVRLIDGPDEWDAIFDRYGINCVIAEKRRNARLIQKLRSDDGYTIEYEDAQSAMFARKKLVQ